MTATAGLEHVDVPVGRVPGADSDRRGRLVVRADGWSLHRPRRRPVHGSWSGGAPALVERLPMLDDLHALRLQLGADTLPDRAGATLAPFAARAAARGTLIHGDRTLAPFVPLGLREVDGVPGDLSFDAAAVRQRRAVLAAGLLDDALGDHEVPGGRPTVSIVVATRRPHLLGRVARVVAAQTYPRLELVVVVHGGDPDDLPHLEVPGVETTVLAAPEDTTLGRALQAGCEVATGELVTKVDDDDHYGPDHVVDLVLAHRYSGAALVGKSTTVVHVEDLDVTVRRVFGTPESFVHRVAGGTILIAREDLATVGGWADVPRAVDSALIGAVRAEGARVYRPHDLGYVYVRHRSTGAEAHTWSAGAGHFLVSAREQWLGLLRHPDLGTA